MSVYDLADFYVHTASVEMFLGTNGYGEDIFAAPVTIVCFVDEASKRVLNKDAVEVLAMTTLATYPVSAPLFIADSRVTVDVIASRVITVKIGKSGPLDLPDHLEVSLT